MILQFRHAFRCLAKSPGYTVVAMLTLALGIAISTSSFSTTNAFLLRSLPYPESDDLVRIFRTTPQSQTANHSPGMILAMAETLSSVEGVTPYFYDLASISEPGQPPEQVGSIMAGAGILEALRLRPAIGAGFTAEHAKPGNDQVVILTDRMWRKRFGADPDVVGKTLRISGKQHTVVGVLPASFHAPLIWNNAEFVRPWALQPAYATMHSPTWLDCFARLKPGVQPSQLNSELATLASRMAAEFPDKHVGDGLRCVGFASSNMGGINTTLIWLMTGLAMAVLLIACANLASLQLARSFGRSREFAIRASLGAGRFQLMQPLLAESLLLSLGGGLLGLVMASWINEYMSAMLLIGTEPGFEFPIDGRVLAFTLGVSLLTGLVFGLVPAWLASRTPAANALKEGARGSTGGPAHSRIRLGLVVMEIALSLVLVAVAAGFAVASNGMLKRDLGWNPDQVFQAGVNRPYDRYPDAARQRECDRRILERVQNIPGVEKAAITSGLPLFSYFTTGTVLPEGMQESPQSPAPVAEVAFVSTDFFALLQVPLREGALFAANIAPDGPQQVVVSDNFAKRFWPGESAVGRRVKLDGGAGWAEVIGVVGTVRMAAGLGAPASPFQVYRSRVQTPNNFLFIAVRGGASPEVLATELRRIVYEIDPDLPLLFPATIETYVSQALSNLDVLVMNLAAYAVMALLISGIGIYGVISHVTEQRTRDIGVRMALGARQEDIARMILGQGLRLLLIGLVVGVLLTTLVLKLVATSMSGFELPGAWLQAVTVCVLAAVTMLACYLPARRASRVDPVIALRAE